MTIAIDDYRNATASLGDAQNRQATATADIAQARARRNPLLRRRDDVGEPDHGPSRLTADDLVAYIASLGLHPHLTVPLRTLAGYYISEGNAEGRAGRRRVCAVGARDRRVHVPRARSRAPDRQQLRGNRRVRQLQARRRLRVRAARRARPDAAPAHLRRSVVEEDHRLPGSRSRSCTSRISGRPASRRRGIRSADAGQPDRTTGSTSTTSTSRW